MRILYITPRIPYPPRKGDQLRAYNQLKGLKKLGHYIHLITFADSVPDELTKICGKVDSVQFNKVMALSNVGTGMLKKMPMQVSYFQSKAMADVIGRVIQENEFDIVHSQLIRTYPYLAQFQHIPNVMDYVDSISLNLNRRVAFNRSLFNPIFRYESHQVSVLEKAALSAYDGGIFISDVDKNSVPSSPDIWTISNGVDLDYFTYQQELPQENHIVFVGNMSYAPNREGMKHFIQHTLPLIKNQNFKLYIVGREPTPDIIELSRKHPNVVVTGEVPDIRPYLHSAKLFICPLKTGAGVQNKVLEAMAAGVPVLTTPLVNDPIGAKDGKSVFVRESDEHFAHAISELITNRELLEQARKAARVFVEQNYKWDAMNKKLEQCYQTIIGKRSKHLKEVMG